MPRGAIGAAGRQRGARNYLSIAGLLAVLLVMMGSHVVVARYDMLALDVLDSDCIFIGDTSSSTDCSADASPSPNGSPTPHRRGLGRADRQPGARGDAGRDRPARRRDPAVGRQGAPQHPAHRQRPAPGRSTYNTDTLIVVSIDPVTKQVAMFSLPRDTVDVPTPPGPARSAFGSVYTRKINAWWTSVRKRTDLFPGNPNKNLPGYNGLKAIIGNLYGLDIKYFVEVNFDGFKKVVDTIGGVTINVQVPVTDDRYPSSTTASGGSTSRPASSTWTAPRRSSTPARGTARTTSTAACASSASCCRCASRPTRRT